MSSMYFTPPLSESQRNLLARALGIAQLNFSFLEVLEHNVLQAFQVVDGEPVVKLEPLEWLATNVPTLEPTVVLQHAGTQLTVNQPASIRTLWEDLFPYPLSEVARGFNPSSFTKTQISPLAFATQIAELKEMLDALEAKICRQEVTFLWVVSADSCFPLLFHYVRGRRIRVGSSAMLWELGRRFDNGLLSVEELKTRFGTQAALFRIELSPNPSQDPIAELIRALYQTSATFPQNAEEANPLFQKAHTHLSSGSADPLQ